MKVKATTAILAMLISAGAWAQNQDPKSPTAYGTGSMATDQGPPTANYQDTGKNKPKHKKSRKHNHTAEMNKAPDMSNPGSAGSSGTSGTTGSGNPGAGEPRPDQQPMTPTNKPVDDTRALPEPVPDAPPIK